MAIKNFKPTTNGRRKMSSLINEEITTDTPEKSLLVTLTKNGGRNNQGKITVRHHGGGAKRKYRLIDFKRNKRDIVGKVATIEYDPNRSANIALINYIDGEKRYIIAPKDIKVGMQIVAGENVDIQVGNALPLKNIPMGTIIHNIETKPGRGGQFARSAGCYGQLAGKDAGFAQIKLNSGELRLVSCECYASIGAVSNPDQRNVNLGKAGRNSWLGRRPHVRGTAMNPVDHPHGGGEGRNFGKHPVSPSGQPTKGYKTRTNKFTDKFILKSRHLSKKK